MENDGNGNVVINMKVFVIIPVVCTLVGMIVMGGLSFGSKFFQMDSNTKNIVILTENVNQLTSDVAKLTGYVHAKYGDN